MSYKAGDVVHHWPTGQDLTVATDVEGGELFVNGGAETTVRAADCTLVRAAPDRTRLETLRRVVNTTKNQVLKTRASKQLAKG